MMEADGRSDLADADRTVTLIGGGRMGVALLAGWLRAGLRPNLVHVVDPAPSQELRSLAGSHGFDATPELGGRMADVLVLAVKPQIVDVVAREVSAAGVQGFLVLSIMAGVRTSRLKSLFPDALGYVRAMPNLPASVGCGATALFTNSSEEHRNFAGRLMATVGHIEWLPDENLIDAATALSGSGPGYVFYMVECLAKAGEKAGLERGTAERLARATVQGAGALLRDSPSTAADLRVAVTSPGGTTQSGLNVLADGDRLCELLTNAVAAARDRSRELST